MPAIEVDDLTRSYGALKAVAGISFQVAEGEVFALLGPNGAGKTTTVEILEGYRHRDGGQVRVLGFDPATGGRAYRERIGIVLQSAGFEEAFTVAELVRLQASFYPRRHDPDELVTLVGLADKRNARVKALSGGQRRRLDLALGLVGAPDLLFLDEPTTGFDPAARHRAWDLIARLRHLGTTILLTTHYIEEAERLADRVAVLRAGHLVAVGSPQELQDGCRLPGVVTFRLPAGTTGADLPDLAGTVTLDGGTVRVETHTAVPDVGRLTGWARQRAVDLPGLTLTQPTLEDVYLTLTGEVDDVH
ncbi:ABC transporter ATP-binding protein [Micromonospora echinofusca]|uniref:ATP-binding cassette domain-containing protein n=1 Tax=Micromonospora echinofusca TaxID=47858 RepID=A0ABS3VQX3_MICEH|nr:ABC transporter ATP-binding protein [Micromonospora echinofusca]MBO4206779.1 ATP-binding cassette domain-containing protein [Micromonospora echinofusca]